MTEQLPAPLVPPEDRRGTPIPLGMFVRLAVDTFGCSPAEAESLVRSWAAMHGVAIDTGSDA